MDGARWDLGGEGEGCRSRLKRLARGDRGAAVVVVVEDKDLAARGGFKLCGWLGAANAGKNPPLPPPLLLLLPLLPLLVEEAVWGLRWTK